MVDPAMSAEETVSANFHRAFVAKTRAAFAMLWEVLALYGAQIPLHVDPTPDHVQSQRFNGLVASVVPSLWRWMKDSN